MMQLGMTREDSYSLGMDVEKSVGDRLDPPDEDRFRNRCACFD